MSNPTILGVLELPVNSTSSYCEIVGDSSDMPSNQAADYSHVTDNVHTDTRSYAHSVLSDSRCSALEEYEFVEHEDSKGLLPSDISNDVLSSSYACPSACPSVHACKSDSFQLASDLIGQPLSLPTIPASIRLAEKMRRWHEANSDDAIVDDNVASWNLNEELQWETRAEATRPREMPPMRVLPPLPRAIKVDQLLTRMIRRCGGKPDANFEEWRSSELEMLRNYIDWAKESRRKGNVVPHKMCGSIPSISSDTSSPSNSEYLWVEI